MWDNFIGVQFRRNSRNLLMTNLVILLGILLIAAAAQRYLTNFFKGPFPISTRDLAAVTDADTLKQYYVTVQGDAVADSGVQEIEQTKDKYSNEVKSERVSASFVVLKVGERLLMVKAEGEHTPTQTTYTGALVEMPEDVRSHTIDAIVQENPDLKDRFIPVLLDATDFKTPGYVGLALGIPLFGLGLWNLKNAQQRLSDPGQHPAAKALGRYGSPQALAGAIDGEVRTSAMKYGPVTITANWLIQTRPYNTAVLQLDDLVWIYKKVVQHRTNFVPTGKTFSAILLDRNGKQVEIASTGTVTDAILVHLAQQRPWILVGFSNELQSAWLRDRAGVIQAVDARRKQAMAPAPSVPDIPPMTQ